MPPKRSFTRFFRLFVKLLSLLVFLILLITVINLRINKVICRQDGQDCDTVNASLVQSLQNTRLVQFSSSKLSKQLTAYPLNQSSVIRFRPPRTVTIDITTHKRLITVQLTDPLTPPASPDGLATPSAVVRQLAVTYLNQNYPNLHPIDITPDGRFVNSDKNSNITLALSPQELNNSQKLSNIFQLVQKTLDTGLSYQKILIADSSAFIRVSPQTYALIDLSQDVAASITSLQQLLAQSTITLEGMIIDLRFNYPVIAPINTPEK